MTIDLLLDCDTGVDDALAILYAAGEGARLTACTVTHGNVPVELGTRNTLTVLDLLGLVDVPVYAGAARPWRNLWRPPSWSTGGTDWVMPEWSHRRVRQPAIWRRWRSSD